MKHKGRGWHGDKSGHQRAGKAGGLVTSSKMTPEFYSRIGKMGGSKSSGKFTTGSQRARIAGQRGGAAKRDKGV